MAPGSHSLSRRVAAELLVIEAVELRAVGLVGAVVAVGRPVASPVVLDAVAVLAAELVVAADGQAVALVRRLALGNLEFIGIS